MRQLNSIGYFYDCLYETLAFGRRRLRLWPTTPPPPVDDASTSGLQSTRLTKSPTPAYSRFCLLLSPVRAAVSAFRREEESQVHHSSKRRRERSDQDRVNYGDSMFMETPQGKGLQFPFFVADRVIIKSNIAH
uniref:Uncharacterized protein n=1 Tax=Lactuca sativa TaxID=4236 RepID=A0A9R1XLU6_LACSA|nr:hypothetical protein LSAT_V11C400174340 [Lactuca sativa]